MMKFGSVINNILVRNPVEQIINIRLNLLWLWCQNILKISTQKIVIKYFLGGGEGCLDFQISDLVKNPDGTDI